jgi:hypothetical protein
MSTLHKYWFQFEASEATDLPPGAILGCGVTAIDLDDAKRLLKAELFPEDELPPEASVVENVDVSTLDKGHVQPNITRDVARRGVWFPGSI